jgi:ParE toxin of type II toxin-antitoxin system, parDE
VTAEKLEFHEEAAAEYDAAFEWYLSRSPDAAQRFDAEVEHALIQVVQDPKRGHLVRSVLDVIYCGDFLFLWFTENEQQIQFKSSLLSQAVDQVIWKTRL